MRINYFYLPFILSIILTCIIFSCSDDSDDESDQDTFFLYPQGSNKLIG